MVRHRCQDCGHVDGAGVPKTQEVDGEKIVIMACPSCFSGRWLSDTVRSIAGVSEMALADGGGR